MEAKQLEKYKRQLYARVPFIGGWFRHRAAQALARDGTPEAIAQLAEAVARSDDGQVRDIALTTLQQVTDQDHINAVCQVWADTRQWDLAVLLTEHGWVASAPAKVRVLTALLVGQLQVVTKGGVDVVDPLVQALVDANRTISENAQLAIGEFNNLQAREALADQLCGLWAGTRSPQLEDMIIRGGYVARQPAKIRILSALKTRQLQLITNMGAEVVEPMLEATKDKDVVIAQGARHALRQIKNLEAREAICRLVIEKDHPVAREAAIQGKYLPRDDYQRALFLFLTEQWDRYEALDFDHRLLRMIYASADVTLRQRLLEKLRTAGSSDFLTVIVGGDYRSRVAAMTWDETKLLVQMLAEKREWPKLWPLVFETSFGWSLYILKILAQSGWQPKPDDELAAFQDLVRLAPLEMVTTAKEVSHHLPPAVQRALTRVPGGRINDVAFSPARPVIALGTSQCRVVIWNFHHATRERMLDGFKHSIGRVTFSCNDVLICAERTNNTKTSCTVYGCCDGQMFRLWEHAGSVTAIESIEGSRVLAAGRDHKVIMLDVNTRRRLEERRFDFWARSARVSPGGRQAALLHHGATLIRLPQLSTLAAVSHDWLWQGIWSQGVSRCAAFSSNGEDLIVGKYNGDVVVFKRNDKSLRPESHPLLRHNGRVESIEVLPRHSIVITAGSEGNVQFTSWANRTPIGSVKVTGQRLTSLHISPDEAFMAIGDSAASLSLWDLRVLDVPILFTRPFIQAVPDHLAAVNALANNTNLPMNIRNALKFIERVLQHRFRFDIEIDELPTIKVGEFDIEIE